MKVRFWGVRDSIPTPGPDTVRYGGETTCFEMWAGSELTILDAGSGIRRLGLHLLKEAKRNSCWTDGARIFPRITR
jgi:phosphoribosyl 1,2-cyclic phosphodiesterase